MAAGMFLTRHPDILQQSFRVTPVYIPGYTKDLDVVDPYTHSIQWSRRFIGLKVFLSLTVAGWQGYREMVKHQIAMGRLLKTALQQSGWQILNSTELPVVCFVPDKNASDETINTIAQSLVATGQFWISITRCHGMAALRACVTSFRTTDSHIDALVRELDLCRQRAFETGTQLR
jgi:glutamate/tyrosine decarboxylase-like PLP-dependent enzyme